MKMTIAPIEERRMLGIGLVLMAFLCFTLIDTAAKWLVTGGMPPMQAAFSRYAMHLLIIMAIFMPRHGGEVLRTRRPGLEILRAIALLASTLLNFVAVQYLPLTITGAIIFSLPLVVCAFSVPLLGEKVGWRRWLAILVGFAGVLIIVQPGGVDFHWAVFFSVGAVCTSALYFILTRKLAGVDSVPTQQFYAGLIATLAIVPFVIGDWVWPVRMSDWVAFIGIGMAGVLGHQLATIAHRFAPASTLAPFAYVQIVYMSAASWLVFDQPPDVWLYVGGPLVIASGLYIWLRERALEKRVTSPISVENG